MAEPAGAAPTPYDTVRYPRYTHSTAHVDRLATQATLFGLNPAPPGACRVLELGCGSGANLVSMAYVLPGSTFVGVDLAAGPIADAARMAREVGLGNVEFLQRDIADLDGSFGTFDYIVAHGVYSWVPPEVADRLLAVCGELLAPEGVAFVSYLAYPGSHARQMMRDIALFHLQAAPDAATVQREARDLAAWILCIPDAGDATRSVLHSDARRYVSADADYLFHDDLTEWNVPRYFTQFVNQAGTHGLQFLAEADPIDMESLDLPDAARERLDAMCPTRLLREQYLDFARARRFRQTLLCRAATTVGERPDPERLSRLALASSVSMPEGGVDLTPEVDVRFDSPHGATLATHFVLGKAALEVLIDAAPSRIPWDDLERAARTRAGADGAASSNEDLREFLVRLYGAGHVSVHATVPALASRPGERPRASAVARWQAGEGPYLTSLTHRGYHYRDDLGVRLVRILDGTRDREALSTDLDGADGDEIDRHLDTLAALGFLEA